MAMYVVGDIHGCYREFMQLVHKIEKQDDNARFILIGDIIDRGPEQLEMLDWAMQMVNKPDGKFQMILGNHEYEKIELIKNYLEQYENSGKAIWGQDRYGFHIVIQKAKLSVEKIRDIYQFITTLPVYIQYECKLGNHKQNYIMVHGDIPRYCIKKDETIRKSAFTKKSLFYYAWGGRSLISDIVWERNLDGHPELSKTIVVHGHTPTLETSMYSHPGRINYRPHDINVDCGITFRKFYPEANLAAIRLEDLQEFYLYEPAEEPLLSEGEKDYKTEMILRPKTENFFS